MSPRRLAQSVLLFAALALTSCSRSDANPDAGQSKPRAGLVGPGAQGAMPLTSTPGLPALPTYRIVQEHPRIFLSDPDVRARLRELLKGNSVAAARFREQVSAELAGSRGYAFQPWYAALIFQLTDDARYARFAIEQTDRFIATEEDRIAGNQRAAVAGDSYLEVGQVIGNLALVYDWCHALLTPSQRERWTAYANQAVWNVWNPTKARWGNTTYAWTGWSIDNPSNNYYYSFLRATMLLGLATNGENPEATKWLQLFREAKIERQLLPTFSRDLTGGGSREGTGYGTAMKNLFQLYDWWQRSTGEPLATRTPHTLASMAHLIHSVVPTLDRLAPTGDHARDSTAALFDYHREYLLVLMALFPDEPLSGIAETLLDKSSVPQMKNTFMYYVDFLYGQPHLKRRPLSDLSTTYWAPGTGQLMMRSSWEPTATYANFICGPYTESHAHRDQGSFVIYKNDWLALDANLYSHSGIEQEEELHNLVRFEGGTQKIRQRPGTTCRLTALADNARYTYAVAHVTPNYQGQPGVEHSEREFLFIKPDTFVVLDRVVVSGASIRRIWTLNLPGPPSIEGDQIRYRAGKTSLDIHRLGPAGSEISARNWTDMRKGMRGGTLVEIAYATGRSSVFLNVLSTNSTVVSATRIDAPDQTGADIKFADGRSATVRFGLRTGVGASLEMRGPDQSIVAGGPLPRSVGSIPLLVQ